MSILTPGWGRRTGMRARVLARALAHAVTLAHALALATAGPAAAGPVTSGHGTRGVADELEVPARLTLGPDGRDLHLAGDLTEGVAARVARLLAAHPQIARLTLTSDGGLVEEGAAIGALVAARGLATYVPDACASACTLIFVRGRRRLIAPGGRLGFHAPYVIGAHGRLRAVDAAAERAAYRAAGLPRDFVARALAVPPAGIWIPDAARLRAAGVVTGIVAPDGAPAPAAAGDPSPRGTGGAILQRVNLPNPDSAPRASRQAPSGDGGGSAATLRASAPIRPQQLQANSAGG